VTTSAYKTALIGEHLGLWIVPPKEDGTKAPDIESWRGNTAKRPDADQIDRWYEAGRSGVGIVCGAASGGLEAIDFDAIEAYDEFVSTARDLGWDDLVDKIEDGYLERSPGGVHWLYYCSELSGNDKLARRLKRPEEMKHPRDRIKTLIETRSEGGYIIIAPSEGNVHETGRPYVLERGSLKTIVTLTPEERRDLLALARTFDRMPEEESQRREAFASHEGRQHAGRPGDDFSQRTSWDDVLSPHGWRAVRRIGDETFWRRPGKDRGQSATTNYRGSDLLYVFSSSTEFEPERGYNRFSAYAILEHNGDWRAASTELRRQGYGEPIVSASLGRLRANDTQQNGSSNGASYETAKQEVVATLPEIYADEQDLRIVTTEAWSALSEANKAEPFMFRQGGALVRVETVEGGKPIFRELSLSVIRHEMARAAVWWGMRGPKAEKERRVVVPPEVVCQDVLATPSPPLPEVVRITECPVFGPDWSLRATSGYHAPARAYCAIPDDAKVPPVSVSPSAEEVTEARRLVLEELLGDFPFETSSDQANAIALFLQPFVRDAIRGPTPIHVVESPTMGTGKGLLVDALLRPSCGRGVAVMAQCRDGDEWRKRITAALRGGHAAIQIDNVTQALDSGELAMAITIPFWSDRLLGSSQTVSYPVRCAWALTANNPMLSTELARRSIRIRLDSKTDRPWERETFRHKELMSWVDENRGDLIWAGLTIIQSWISSGCTSFSGKNLGSFEVWSRIIGGILEHIEVNGFLGNLREFYEVADAEGETWRAFVEGWWERFGTEKVGAAVLFALAVETEGMDLGHGNENSQKMVFGRALAKQRDRVIGDYTIKSAGTSKRLAQWKLMPKREML
jgi:hypothetical protein